MTNQEVIRNVINLVNNYPLGILTTISDDGEPHARWMGTAAMDGVRRIYTLSGQHARKIEHIRRHPQVSWVFSDPHHLSVASLFGTATVEVSGIDTQAVWDMLSRSATSYAMGVTSDDANIELCCIETRVQRVELISPRHKQFHPLEVSLATD
jgi:general stress protein 26